MNDLRWEGGLSCEYHWLRRLGGSSASRRSKLRTEIKISRSRSYSTRFSQISALRLPGGKSVDVTSVYVASWNFITKGLWPTTLDGDLGDWIIYLKIRKKTTGEMSIPMILIWNQRKPGLIWSVARPCSANASDITMLF